MSFSSGDFLNTIQSHDFEIQITTAETENVDSTHNTAHYLQLIIDNLMLALNKEIDESIQNKIQFVLAKTQHILLNAADSEFDSQLDIQHQIQSIKTDVITKFQEIQAMISNLQFVNIPAASQLNIAESASQSASQTSIQSNLTSSIETSSSSNSDQNTEEKTYAQALRVLISLQSSNEKISSSSILQKTEKMSATSSKSQSRTHYSNQNKKKSDSQFIVANSAAVSSFFYRERRLILVNSRASSIDSMKTRDKINQEFQKQLKLSDTELVIAAIIKSIKQQNVV